MGAFADRVILNKCDLVAAAGEVPGGAVAAGKGGNTEKSAETTAAEGGDCVEVTAAGHTVGNNRGGTGLDADTKIMESLGETAEKALKKVEDRIHRINAAVPIIRTQFGRVDPTKLLNINAFDLNKVLEMDPEFLDPDAEHEHDESVSSVAWSVPGMELNVNRLQDFISEILRDMGTDLYRYKGVLAVKGKKEKFVFQGVHMLFSGGFAPEGGFWKDGEERECRFVFIGKYVKQKLEERLKNGFMACKAEEPLRFNVGDTVTARAGGGWQKALVLKQWDDGNPYRLEIQNKKKTNVWGPIDDDSVIKVWDGPLEQ